MLCAKPTTTGFTDFTEDSDGEPQKGKKTAVLKMASLHASTKFDMHTMEVAKGKTTAGVKEETPVDTTT